MLTCCPEEYSMHSKLLLVILIAASHATVAKAENASPDLDSRFVGWLGDTYYEAFKAAPARNSTRGNSSPMSSSIEVLSWNPRVFVHHNFLASDECDRLRARAAPRLQPSVVVNPDKGTAMLSQDRSSTGMFFNRREDPLITAVEQRIVTWTMLPAENGEGIQVLRYEPGQEYTPHHDFFYSPSSMLNGGNRIATVIMYLSDVEEGGETIFPDVQRLPHQTPENGWTDCGMLGLGIRPKKGDALLFWSKTPDGIFDPLTRHASCPVVKGEKVVATRWIHEKVYNVRPDQEGPLPLSVQHRTGYQQSKVEGHHLQKQARERASPMVLGPHSNSPVVIS